MRGVSGGDAPQSDDPVSARLVGLENRLREDLGNSATVERGELAETESGTWDVQPVNPRALPVNWMEWGDQIILQAGLCGGRWELDRTPADVDFIEAVVRAAVAGRVVETRTLARSRVDVTFADGRTVHETGYEGCLFGLVPLPGWRRWGKVTRYEPYASPSR